MFTFSCIGSFFLTDTTYPRRRFPLHILIVEMPSNSSFQIIIVKDPEVPTEEDPNSPKIDNSTFDYDSGITPPTRHIRKRKWRRKPIYSRAEVSLAEEELHKITKGQDPSESMEFVSPEEILRERAILEQKNNPKLDSSSSSVTSVGGLKVKVSLKRSNASIPKPPKNEEDTVSSDDE